MHVRSAFFFAVLGLHGPTGFSPVVLTAAPCSGFWLPSAGPEALSLNEVPLVGSAVVLHGLQSLLGVWDLPGAGL